ncbi:hypothetical protein [Streptomyces sp. NBC_00083]|uniref:hypothetical protein n=1 Tax=Streptomyces sp. NBC_00083 TaxID=2975647 RepID=UPI00224E0147|nr:hypothetical protein [Streptomyces sp. NBC_00083]MCX5387130.1 hypothetical protein [Streptomyces sp. NBC_00083]
MTWTKRRTATARTALAVRAAVSTATLAACGLLLVACSSSASSSAAASGPASASSSASSATGKGMDAYRQCLAQHGVTMAPRPAGSGRPGGWPSGRPSGRPSGGARHSGGGGGGGGFGGFGGGASADPAQRQAAQACASLRPQFGGRGAGGDSTAMKAFTSCLKDHGVVLPSASPGAGGGMRGLNTADPKTAGALGICKTLLPQRTPNPSSTPTP